MAHDPVKKIEEVLIGAEVIVSNLKMLKTWAEFMRIPFSKEVFHNTTNSVGGDDLQSYMHQLEVQSEHLNTQCREMRDKIVITESNELKWVEPC